MVFSEKEALRFASPHNDPLVVEMKIASPIIHRILIDTGSSVDIITWDCLKKATHPGRDIIPLVHPILGFGGEEVNPTCMISLSLCFDDKLKARNLEVHFLIINVLTTYNVILGHPTLHKPEKYLSQTRGHNLRGQTRFWSVSSWLAGSQGAVSPFPNGAQHRQPLAQGWRPWSQRPSILPLLALHKTKKKSGQNQTKRPTNTGAANTLRKILKLYRLHYELWDRFRLDILPDVIVKVSVVGSLKGFLMGLPSFQSGMFP
ncbi:hypothetical protein Cgig2_028168 [Carnegiea gigantea]|uniref:Peptidase A2 domain-containing protein n=1 Tax=Carnegiea gigantea TaxID=171969 RepID=A0A9Q1GY00_9CARY|nr:hypothetical protein Cgig2_028168 [Carnegiea gigantea]